jgi:hypothetical protein
MGFLKNLLGLGVAAGTAYAAVKVAQKYNEKKNANADLNGDGAVDANDTVYGVKEAAREVYAETAAKVREKAPEVREKAAAAIGAVQEKAPEFIEKVKGWQSCKRVAIEELLSVALIFVKDGRLWVSLPPGVRDFTE